MAVVPIIFSLAFCVNFLFCVYHTQLHTQTFDLSIFACHCAKKKEEREERRERKKKIRTDKFNAMNVVALNEVTGCPCLSLSALLSSCREEALKNRCNMLNCVIFKQQHVPNNSLYYTPKIRYNSKSSTKHPIESSIYIQFRIVYYKHRKYIKKRINIFGDACRKVISYFNHTKFCVFSSSVKW